MNCQNATCYLILECRIKYKAENCAIHKRFLKGEPVFQYSDEEIKEIKDHWKLPQDSTKFRQLKNPLQRVI